MHIAHESILAGKCVNPVVKTFFSYLANLFASYVILQKEP